jgi:cytochrome c oxidase cbb3-type subunit 3
MSAPAGNFSRTPGTGSEPPATSSFEPGSTSVNANPERKVVHVYDDIEEEDNHLPNWWLATLFGAIVFGFGYWFVYEVTGAAMSPLASFRAETAEMAKKRAEAGPVTNEALTVLSRDAKTLAEGKQIFATTCLPCHGAQGQGLVGPNLTDKFWLHGGTPVEIHKSITGGYPEKGMQAWGKVLGAGRVRSVAAFVLSIKGQNLPGKPPQGTAVE